MQFKTYMQKNKPVYMYLHGECLSAFSFQEEIRELKKDYTLIVPILDGHGGEAQKPFISIQDCAEQLLSYIQTHFNGHIQVLSGCEAGVLMQAFMPMLWQERNGSINSCIIPYSMTIMPLKIITAIIRL